MKKIISWLLTVCIVTAAMSFGLVTAFAEGTLIDGTDVKWSYDYETKVLSFSGEGAIPDYDSYSDSDGIIELKYPWKDLEYTSLSFGEGITGIGNYAFCYSTKLESVVIPANVSVLGKGIFLNCKALVSAEIGSDASKVGDSMFSGCSALERVTLPDTLESISYRMFYRCSAVNDITLPEKVEIISEGAFYQCISLEKIDLSNVLSISKSAFYNCEKLVDVIFNQAGVKIGENAFDSCTALKSLDFPESGVFFSADAFSGCTALESLTLPFYIDEIPENTFNICTSLKGVIISAEVNSIGKKAFGYGKRGAKIEDFTITGYDGTAAEKYADENGFIFNSLGDYYSGKLGDEAEWSYDIESGELSVTGTGALYAYTVDSLPEFVKFNGIKTVVVGDGIDNIAENSLNFTAPIESITFGPNVTAVEENSFGFVRVYDEDSETEQWTLKPIENLVVMGYNDTPVKDYAIENGFDFVSLDIDVPFEFPELVIDNKYTSRIDAESFLIYFFNTEVGANDFVDSLNKDDYDSAELDAELAVTGSSLTLAAGEESRVFTVILKGDTNSDGKVNSSDALDVLKHSVGLSALEGNAALAGDLTGEGELNSSDALLVLQVSVGQRVLSDFAE